MKSTCGQTQISTAIFFPPLSTSLSVFHKLGNQREGSAIPEERIVLRAVELNGFDAACNSLSLSLSLITNCTFNSGAEGCCLFIKVYLPWGCQLSSVRSVFVFLSVCVWFHFHCCLLLILVVLNLFPKEFCLLGCLLGKDKVLLRILLRIKNTNLPPR